MNASRFILLSLALSPMLLPGQKKEELASIQRDVASMDDHVKQLQKTFDDKITALTALLQQAIDNQNKTQAALTAMQRNLDQKLVDQQTKLVAPVATLGTKVDDMSGDINAIQANVKELIRKTNDQDAKLKDISDAIRTLNNPAPPPPQPVANQPGTAAQVPDGPPAGMTPELAYNNALNDFKAKKDDAAFDEFANYLKYYPQTENAPNAQFYIGQIYYRGQDWPDAVKSFDAVLEKYPVNSKTQEAQYMKACALMNDKKNTAAGQEFKAFIAQYPNTPRAHDAHLHLQELGMEVKKRK